MDFFSKLFGGKNKTKEQQEALDLLKNVFNQAADEKKKEEEKKQAAPQQQAQPVQERREEAPEGPSGESWGPVMPAEENQYNFNGTYQQYFEKIWNEDFGLYRVEKEAPKYKGVIYNFYGAAGKSLVVELLPSSSEAKKLREKCAAAGVPYLRYYYDYDGWWNTKEYVKQRTRIALMGG
jgi:hypothetical protein